MKPVPKVSCIVALIALALVFGCHKQGQEPPVKPSKMAGPLHSGENLDKVNRELGTTGADWVVVEDREPLVSDTRPPFKVQTFSTRKVLMYGQSGELIATFFNDRLMTTMFYPSNVEAFRSAVEKNDEVGLGATGDATIAPSTRVWVGKDSTGRRYVGWMDRDLQQREDAWIRQYEK